MKAQRALETMHTWLCVNAASGSNTKSAVATVAEALEAAGASPARIIDVPTHGVLSPGELAEAGVGRVAIFAGDGTTNTVVTALEGWDGEVLPLPGGTANLLARALHGDRDAAAIAADLPWLRRVRRNCIRGGGHTALIEILAGPGATWSDVREILREGDLPGIAASSIAALRQSLAGPMVAISEPSLGRTEGYSGIRLEATDDGILVEGYGADTVADYLRQGIALLRRDFRQGPHDDLGLTHTLVCRSQDHASIELMIDGERRTANGEERFSLAPLAVDLLASPR